MGSIGGGSTGGGARGTSTGFSTGFSTTVFSASFVGCFLAASSDFWVASSDGQASVPSSSVRTTNRCFIAREWYPIQLPQHTLAFAPLDGAPCAPSAFGERSQVLPLDPATRR